MDTAFQHLKACICHMLLSTTLPYYERTKPVIVWTDASEYGLDASLHQSGSSITFASKTLTNRETHYTNIEGECLSMCFGLKEFHTYLYGRYVFVQNDHKPLGMVQHKSIHAAPPNLQQMLLHMQKYDYTIQYQPDKEMILANHLSHFPFHKESCPIAIHQNIQHIQISNNKLDAIRGAVEHDPVYKACTT